MSLRPQTHAARSWVLLWIGAALGLLLLAGCGPTPEAIQPTVLPPTSSLTSTPVPTDTPSPAPTGSNNTPTPTRPTATPSPSPSPTTTSTPMPPLTAHEWLAQPVLVWFGSRGGDGGDESTAYLQSLPSLILYSDGQLLVSDEQQVFEWVWDAESSTALLVPSYPTILWEANLDRQQTCAILNTIERTGFFDYDPDSYSLAPELGRFGPFDGEPMTVIRIDAWRSNHMVLDALSHFLEEVPPPTWTEKECRGCAPLPIIPPSLRNTYFFLSRYRPADPQPYIPDKIALWFYSPDPRDDELPWPLQSPSLADLYLRSESVAGLPWAYGDRRVVLQGAEAKAVYEIFGNGIRLKTFRDGEQRYRVIAHPGLPYGALLDYTEDDTVLEPPETTEKKPERWLSCQPSDGVLDIPGP